MQILTVNTDLHFGGGSLNLVFKEHGFGRIRAEDEDDALQILGMDCYVFDAVMYSTEYKGDTFAKTMRSRRLDHPLIIVTSRVESDFRVAQLNDGADHVQIVPMDKYEFGAYVMAVVRRASNYSSSRVTIGKFSFDMEEKTAYIGEFRIHLTTTEYQILEALILARGKVVSKDRFMELLYADRDEPHIKIMDVYICQLRDKFSICGKDFIQTVWGRGYRVNPHHPEPAQ